MEAENPTQMEGVVDVDAIPSLEPTSPRFLKGKIEHMDIDPPNRTLEPNLMKETILPTEEVGEEITEFNEPRTQASAKPTQQEQTPAIEKKEKR